jgi:PHD/YefM family antitoxin component YafN of YafNO toxin-antitoxin module
MDAVSYSDLRQNLKTYMDKVYGDHDPLKAVEDGLSEWWFLI